MITHRCLAIDIGASSGRHILGWLEDGVLKLEEIHRFPNGMEEIDGSLCWDVDALVGEIILGLKKCAQQGKIPTSVGIDTWGVDYVLIDKSGNRVGPAIAYRDSRTDGIYEKLFKIIPESELYSRVGLQKQPFNSINQLLAAKLENPQYFDNAEHLLFMPDYLHYRLCGAKKTEYTIASTSGLVNAIEKDWDWEIISRCGFPEKIFGEIVPAGTAIGKFSNDIQKAVGFDCTVIMPPSHDTASAFLAVPAKSKNSVYISSGTWSLMGIELQSPITNDEARIANFTNEGGYNYRYRFLKNIMGLWLLQSVRSEIGDGVSYADLVGLARASSCESLFDVNSDSLFSPKSMVEEVKSACKEHNQPEPSSLGDYAKCICRSLASFYAQTVKQLETLSGKSFDYVNIIGGGSENMYLNELTALACNLPVIAGPAEATAIGNIVSQMLAAGEIKDVESAREIIRQSFSVREVSPEKIIETEVL